MTLDDLERAVAPFGLFVMGWTKSTVLIGTDAGWWDVFQRSAEFKDGQRDPVDRWSKRILNTLAHKAGAQAYYPSDGPPFAPFIAWAIATGQFWQSPTGMMIHKRAGLMISIRGALEFSSVFEGTAQDQNPCDTCPDRPCISACPVDALSDAHAYDVPACKAYLDTPYGTDCMSRGCQVRRVCPISAAFARPEEQSGFHMRAFQGPSAN